MRIIVECEYTLKGFMGPVASIEMERLLGGGSAHLEEKQPRTAILRVL